MRPLLPLLCLIGPLAAWADDPATVAATVEACFEKGKKSGDQGCIGDASLSCQQTANGGMSTLGMAQCNAAETAAWDRILKREYVEVLAFAQALDAEDSSPAGSAVEIAQSAERDWKAYKDSQCLMEYAGWGGGSMRNIASSDCKVRLTAERAFYLYSWSHSEPEE
ncbi:MAG: DUF1311 domain-containing protein [Proteobacteria bacterium]|nr:DUF1311 domain-containing protein [Pseudomonadota bacterium]MBS0574267.1 DUF1311 domain-containing protein [Pseudomonadota bacterium]